MFSRDGSQPPASAGFVVAPIVSESQGQTLVTVCQLKPCSSSNDFTFDIHLHTRTRACRRTNTSALKYGHQSPGVSQPKCVLASRAQQGRIKSKNNCRSCSVFVSHSYNSLTWEPHSFSSFHYPFIWWEYRSPKEQKGDTFWGVFLAFRGCRGYVQMHFH